MKSPFTGKNMKIVKEFRTLNFRKDSFKILSHLYKCEDTGQKFEDDAFAQLNYNQLVNQYRVKYAIPFPDQIIAIRKKYNLSATKMSEILGFGANSYRQYESGEVPNLSNAKLIQLAENPHEFKKLIVLCGTLKQKFIDKLNNKINTLIEEEKVYKSEKRIEDYLFGKSLPNSITGFKTPDFKKFSEMIIYFTETLQPWKTKLNKLLFYADFTMFKQSGFSISGTKYKALPMGPVPDKFNSIFEYLANKNEIDIYYTNFANGGTGEQFRPNKNRKFNADLFSKEELGVMKNIVERFKNVSTNEIIEISHKEKAWIENQAERKFIDYNYSFDLNI